MKRLMIIFVLVAIAIGVGAQEPSSYYMVVGPTYQGDAWSMKIAAATPLVGKVLAVPFVDLGTSVEAGVELTVLYAPFGSKWLIGPVASIGADWNAEPGTETPNIITYMTSTAGVAMTYEVFDGYGIWAYYRTQFAWQGESDYDSGSAGGVGVYVSQGL